MKRSKRLHDLSLLRVWFSGGHCRHRGLAQLVDLERDNGPGGFLLYRGLCTAHLVHHRIPGLHLETAPYPIFGPPVGFMLTYCTLAVFHVSSLILPFFPIMSLSPCLSMILYYTFDSCMSPPNGHVTSSVHKPTLDHLVQQPFLQKQM
jgi:hypothetical protein